MRYVVTIFMFVCIQISCLSALDRATLQDFAKEYDMRSKGWWSEFIYAIEMGYDEIALFYAGKKPKFTYESHREELIYRYSTPSHHQPILHKYNKIYYKNAINTILSKQNIELLTKLLELYPSEVNAVDYSTVPESHSSEGRIQYFDKAN